MDNVRYCLLCRHPGTVPRGLGWGLCDRLCLVLVCKGRYGLERGVSSFHSGIEFGRSRTGKGSSGGRKKGVV
jgi:hypothetical protein